MRGVAASKNFVSDYRSVQTSCYFVILNFLARRGTNTLNIHCHPVQSVFCDYNAQSDPLKYKSSRLQDTDFSKLPTVSKTLLAIGQFIL